MRRVKIFKETFQNKDGFYETVVSPDGEGFYHGFNNQGAVIERDNGKVGNIPFRLIRFIADTDKSSCQTPKPLTRFTDNHDETITDNKTGLIWMKDANYLRGRKSWKEAIEACKKLGNGWRLPTIQELLSLIDYSQFELALPQGHPFINVQSSWYWSATTYASNTSRAWIVGMNGCGYAGYDDKAGYGNYVWAVRGKKKKGEKAWKDLQTTTTKRLQTTKRV